MKRLCNMTSAYSAELTARAKQVQASCVSVVMVNFNGGSLLEEATRAALASTMPVEVIVVDNGSTDDSLSAVKHIAERDHRLTVIEAGKNLGFSRATNLGMAAARGEWLLVLNPDCMIAADTLKRVVQVMMLRADVGAAGCLIQSPDGSEQRGARRRLPTPWRSLVDILHLKALFPGDPRFSGIDMRGEPLGDKPTEVEAISGALMLVRRSALGDVGFLDEGYFLHCEDLDWCMRFRCKGWKIVFVPDTTVVHHKGTCSRGRPIRVEWHKHRGMMRFYRKFFREQYPLPLMGVVAVGIWMHFALLAAVYSIRHVGRLAGIARG